MKKNNIISDWLDKYGDTEIDKKVEMKLEEMNKERYNHIIDEVYKNYEGKRQKWEIGRVGEIPKLSKEEFINKCKTDPEFSERWGLKIEERELIAQERLEWVKTNLSNVEVGGFISNDEYSHKWVETLANNIPTKLITLTYNNETIESYE